MHDHVHIITRADDAGASRSANRAIRETCERGVCRNIGFMACGPYIEDAAEQLRHLDEVCFGIHTTLNSEWLAPKWGPVRPAQEVPHLVDEQGHFLRTPPDLVQHVDKMPPMEEILAELAAQLDRLTGLGLKIRYLDEHMFWSRGWAGWPPSVYTALAGFAQEKGLVFDPPLMRPGDGQKGEGDYATEFLKQLELAEPGQYLVIAHPCYDDEEMRTIEDDRHEPGYHAQDRDAQRRQYVDEAVVRFFAEGKVIATRYDELT